MLLKNPWCSRNMTKNSDSVSLWRFSFDYSFIMRKWTTDLANLINLNTGYTLTALDSWRNIFQFTFAIRTNPDLRLCKSVICYLSGHKSCTESYSTLVYPRLDRLKSISIDAYPVNGLVNYIGIVNELRQMTLLVSEKNKQT